VEIACDYCGKVFTYKGGPAHYRRTKNHYCSRSCQGNGNNINLGNRLHGLARNGADGKQDKRYRIWCGVKKRALQKGIAFEIEPDDIPDIPAQCPVLGIEIEENTGNGPLDSSPSLDRIHPEKGYVRGNIRIISNRANRLRQDATKEEMVLLLEDIKRHG